MNEYAIFCKVELMLVVDAEDEQEARRLAAQSKFTDWEYFMPRKEFNIELLGPSDELDDEQRDIERRYREKDLNRPANYYEEASHGS